VVLKQHKFVVNPCLKLSDDFLGTVYQIIYHLTIYFSLPLREGWGGSLSHN